MAKPNLNDFYVYVLFRWNGTPMYVGKGRRRRIDQHRSPAFHRKSSHKDRTIAKTLRILGDLPRVKLREGLSNEESQEIERALISALGRYPNGSLLNGTDGGDGSAGRVFSVSEETRAKMRASALAQPPEVIADRIARLPKMSAEELANIRRTGPLSAETRSKMSAAHKGKSKSSEHRENQSRYALDRSPEHRDKLRKAAIAASKSLVTRERRRLAAIERWKNPEYREKYSRGN